MVYSYLGHLIDIVLINFTSLVLLATLFSLSSEFLKYGKTSTNKEAGKSKFKLDKIVSFLLKLQLPKSWFIHFYVISFICSSLFIIFLISLKNKSLVLGDETLDFLQKFIISPNSIQTPLPYDISLLVLFLNLIQASRRLYECYFNFKPNKFSKINVSHYVVGIFFYFAINVNILIKTIPNFIDESSIIEKKINSKTLFNLRIIFSILLFIIASIDQHINHVHLSKLVKYSIPRFGLFKLCCCAHYFDEILLYLSEFIILMTDRTAFVILVWVLVNLSVSSNETFKFYQKKSKEQGKKYTVRYRIIPLVY
ncbi:hypothetical protein PACTADRAFT_140345 [Pachysolen tannophilus NRRL Y-2460]|uniref:Polyprenal reductase n=1 Tax=Pachysolen tannophilus NRRL Y-2460 TaxID=669874 RepID=A0A1E4U0W8_PACTA|nr:hypothetical protein PACTADRAFT_140345 [Pachysolen tannophilus NRRL Y-2460]